MSTRKHTTVEADFATGTTWRPDQGEHPRTITGKLVDVRSGRRVLRPVSAGRARAG